MDNLNTYAPAIQALAAVVIVLLTGVLAVVTWKYVQVSEAQLKPCVMIQSELRAPEDAVIDAPFITQVRQVAGNAVIANVGTGPALDLRYQFTQINVAQGVVAINPRGFLTYLQAGKDFQLPLAASLLATRDFDFEATYTSLSQKKYKTKIRIVNRVIRTYSLE